MFVGKVTRGAASQQRQGADWAARPPLAVAMRATLMVWPIISAGRFSPSPVGMSIASFLVDVRRPRRSRFATL